MPAKRSAKPSKTRQRKPRQQRAQFTVDSILEATARVLARSGWDALTTNRVAAEAGVSIGSVYEYFRDKQSIVAALLDAHLTRGEALLAERAALVMDAPSRPVHELVKQLVDAFVALHADNPRLHRVLSSEVPLTPAMRRRARDLIERATALVESQLRSHPDVHVPDPQLAARLVVDTCDALTHRWLVDHTGKPLPWEELSRELTLLLVGYLSQPGERGVIQAYGRGGTSTSGQPPSA